MSTAKLSRKGMHPLSFSASTRPRPPLPAPPSPFRQSRPTVSRTLILPISPLLVLFYLCSLHSASAFHFYLHVGQKRCFSESAPPNTKILLEYTVSTGTGLMPVDLSVKIADVGKPIVDRQDVEHGKIGFVIPYPEVNDMRKVYMQQARRRRKMSEFSAAYRAHYGGGGGGGGDGGEEAIRRRQEHKAYYQQSYGHGAQQAHHEHDRVHSPRRRLLSVEEHASGGGHAAEHARQGDVHTHGQSGAAHGHEMRSVYNVHRHNRDDVDDDDHDDDDVDDDDESLYMDDYDGIHDEDLDAEVTRNAHLHSQHAGNADMEDDLDRERELFDTRRFDICFTNVEHKNEARRRRIKLVFRKGDSAHDYTRLAKTEHISQLETSLKQISSELHQLMYELDRTQQMEAVLFRLNQGTNQRVVILSVVALATMIAIAAYQSIYTRRFFKRKKVL